MLATTVANWQRLKTTLGKALELPVNKRVEYITTACQDDLALTQEILRLLAQHGVTEFMEAPPLPCELDDQTVWVGRQLGVYEITEELPPGGMGRVFKAKRADGQYESIVAIKVLRSAVDMLEIRQRFYIERQILAKLQHPNIAHMLDGGIVDGLPYFVMEYVDGVAIDKYCGDHHLPLNRRLQLLIAICHAVEAAHQQLIVHRDLKPENILVLEQEVPKLLDFGIAKLLTEESLDSKLATQTNVTKLGGTGPYTPSFAAPEQFKGQNITTATDVYGLGGVMYRLLTGGVPFESAGSDPLALMQRVCEQEAKQPSEVIELFNENSQRAIRRGLGSDSQLAHSLRGELNIIALKALAKEPSQRYQTVGQLRRDLENYLQGRPIVARPASLRYVALKFIQRHRALVVTAALGVLALAVGVAGTAWQAHVSNILRAQSDRRLKVVQNIAEKHMFEYFDAIRELPGSLPVATKIASDSTYFLDELVNEDTTDPSVLEDLAASYQRLADIQGKFDASNNSNLEQASNNWRKSYEIRKRLLEAAPHDPKRLTSMLEIIYEMELETQRTADYSAKRKLVAYGIAIGSELSNLRPNDAQALLRYAHQLFADVTIKYFKDKSYGAALEEDLKARKLLERANQLHSNDVEVQGSLASTYQLEGRYRSEVEGNFQASRLCWQHAFEWANSGFLRNKEDMSNRAFAADILSVIAFLDMSMGSFKSVRDDVMQAEELLRPALSPRSSNKWAFTVERRLAPLKARLALQDGDIKSANEEIRNTIHLNEEVYKNDKDALSYGQSHVITNFLLAQIAVTEKRWQDGKTLFASAIKEMEPLVKRKPELIVSLFSYRDSYARLLITNRQNDQAIQVLGATLDDLQPVIAATPSNQSLERLLARTKIRLGVAYEEISMDGNIKSRDDARRKSLAYYAEGGQAMKTLVDSTSAYNDDNSLLQSAFHLASK